MWHCFSGQRGEGGDRTREPWNGTWAIKKKKAGEGRGAGPVAQNRDKRPPWNDREARHNPHILHTQRHIHVSKGLGLCVRPSLSLSLKFWVSCSLLLSHFLSAFARTRPPAPRMFLLLIALKIMALGKTAVGSGVWTVPWRC